MKAMQVIADVIEELQANATQIIVNVTEKLQVNATQVVANATEDLSSNIQSRNFWISALYKGSRISTRDVLIMISYFAIIVVSTFGNLLVCSIVVRNTSLRGATYVFIANLAASNLLMTVLNIPFNVVELLLNDWPFGNFMCSLVPLMRMIFVYVSTFTMSCIAVDRYRIIKKPLRPKMSTTQAIKIIICIWISAAVLSLPYAIFSEVDSIFTYRPLTRCRTIYPENTRPWIRLTTFVTQYVLPLSVIGILYCLIVAKVRSRSTLGVVTEAQLINNQNADSRGDSVFLVLVTTECVPLTPRLRCHPIQKVHAHHHPFLLPVVGDEFRMLQPIHLLLLERTFQSRSRKLHQLGEEFGEENKIHRLRVSKLTI
ncbi:unnamed protein product [Larinioides sclopetarius]|uniref:G-protein coupled receptors family 1 profile domain-containing protein n=1 Tax=Larinioides sclopetarius TaxID=280406 RepID=A0AAV1ZJ01_9ARAC